MLLARWINQTRQLDINLDAPLLSTADNKDLCGTLLNKRKPCLR